MFEKYYRINQAGGLSIFIGPGDSYVFNACLLKLEGKLLTIESKITDIYGLTAVEKHFSSKSAIAVNFNGKGILHKQVERMDNIDRNNFSKVLPNGNINDFYIQNLVSNDYSFVSLIRKNEADKWIAEINKLGFDVMMVSLGPFPVKNVISQVNIYGDEIVFNGHIIHRDENAEWINYNFDTTALAGYPLKIESEPINEKLLIPYAAAFQLILSSKINAITADVELLANNLKSKIENNRLKVNSFAILCCFLLFLLVNFGVLTHLNSLNTQLASQLTSSSQNEDEIDQLNNKVKSGQKLLDDLGWDGGINKTALLDQAAALLPQQITLHEISINPVDQAANRVRKTITFSKRIMRITGESQNILPVNEWIARLKTKKWLRNIQLESYKYQQEKNTGEFIILINY